MKKKVLITSALPYANGPLHFGHMAGAYLPADCYARFERMQGNDVLYVCGSDEYGVAITLGAEQAGRTPKEHVDLYHHQIIRFFERFTISFDHYGRTTCREHAEVVQRFFLDLLANGYIEKRETEQLYSEQDGRFLADRYVVGTCPRCHFEEARGDECQKCGESFEATDLKNPRSKVTGAPLSRRKTVHWFLLFDKFKEKLGTFLSERPWRPNVVHFAKRYIEEIQARSITRDLEWGVPVPLDEAKGKVFYVWFDAPIGYISATKEWNEKRWEEYWLDPRTKYVQFIGKDNIPFHALFFPAMTMGQNIPYKLVDDLVANEFYNLEGKQFSKSDGWFIDLETFFARFHVDQIRYTLAANAPETGDSEFTWKDFQTRCNAELLGKLGNYVNRVLVFVQNKCGGQIPKTGPLEEVDHRFLNDVNRIISDIEESYASYRLRKASGHLMELASAGNTYFDIKAPWKGRDVDTTIASCLECLKSLALAAYPLIPTTASKIWELIGNQELKKARWKEALETPLVAGRKLPKPYILFQKVEDEMIEQESAKLQAMHERATEVKEPPYAPLKEQIGIDDVAKLDLRVGKVLKAEKAPKSKKLLVLEVDIGMERRTILSGISAHYTPEELIGKKVIVVANLKPAKLMGIESQGMLLAGAIDSSLEVVTVEGLPAGAEVS